MITLKSPLRGTGEAHAEQINSLVWSVNPKAPALGSLYVAHGRAHDVVAEIAAGQMILETGHLRSERALRAHNPAGMMREGKLIEYPSWYEGVSAHCGHLRKYATPGTVYWQMQEKRTGSAGTLRDMAHVWAPPELQPKGLLGGDTYAQAVADVANRILAQRRQGPPGIVGHWAEQEVQVAMARGWLRGDENGYAWPDRPITRAELATVLSRVIPPPHPAPYRLPLPRDVPPGHWAAEAIRTAINAAWMTTDALGRFRPDEPASRAEVAVALYQARIETVTSRTARAFPDVPRDSPYAGSITAAYRSGWLNGYPDGMFRPEFPLLRGELAAILARAYPSTRGLSAAVSGVPQSQFIEAAWVERERLWVPGAAVPTLWSLDDTYGTSLQLQPPEKVAAVPLWLQPPFWLALGALGLTVYALSER